MSDDSKEYHALVLQLINPEQVRFLFNFPFDFWFILFQSNTAGDSFVGAEQKEGIIS